MVSFTLFLSVYHMTKRWLSELEEDKHEFDLTTSVIGFYEDQLFNH